MINLQHKRKCCHAAMIMPSASHAGLLFWLKLRLESQECAASTQPASLPIHNGKLDLSTQQQVVHPQSDNLSKGVVDKVEFSSLCMCLLLIFTVNMWYMICVCIHRWYNLWNIYIEYYEIHWFNYMFAPSQDYFIKHYTL